MNIKVKLFICEYMYYMHTHAHVYMCTFISQLMNSFNLLETGNWKMLE